MHASRFLVVLVACVPAACVQGGLEADAGPVELDRAYFDCKVQPVLTKYCATFVCHGDGRRFYRIYARNRLRLGGTEEERNAFLRERERQANYVASVAMVDPVHPEDSLLLLKPTGQGARGYYHGGATEFGMGDVFEDEDDPDLRILREWVNGATEDPQCVEPGSDM